MMLIFMVHLSVLRVRSMVKVRCLGRCMVLIGFQFE